MDSNNQKIQNYLQTSQQQQFQQQHSSEQQLTSIQQQELQTLQNSQAFKQLSKQIQKMRKYYLSIGYNQKQVSDMLHDVLLRKQNQDIDWKKLSNTSDFYQVKERYNSTSQIAESALKFKKEINQMKNICKDISQNNNQQYEYSNNQPQKDGFQFNQNGLLNRVSDAQPKINMSQNQVQQSIFGQNMQSGWFTSQIQHNGEKGQNIINQNNIENNKVKSQQQDSTINRIIDINSAKSIQQNKNPNQIEINQNNFDKNQNQFDSTLNQLDKKAKQKLFDINEISDRFLYRLDRNCSIEKSSSSSESGEQENYHYKINNKFLQSENEFEQDPLQNKGQEQTNQQNNGQNTNSRVNNIQNQSLNQNQNQNQNNKNKNDNQQVKQKQTFYQNIKNNFPEAASAFQQGVNSTFQNNIHNSKYQNNGCIQYIQEDDYSCGNSVNDESQNSYNSEQMSGCGYQKKKKKRKQKNIFQDNLPNLLEQNEILIDKQKKKLCRGIQYRDELTSHKHNYAGKKRTLKYNYPFQNQENNDFQDFPDLEDLHLLEKKFRYFTETDLIDEDQNLPQQQ